MICSILIDVRGHIQSHRLLMHETYRIVYAICLLVSIHWPLQTRSRGWQSELTQPYHLKLYIFGDRKLGRNLNMREISLADILDDARRPPKTRWRVGAGGGASS